MSTVRITVTAWREGRWWVIDVPGYGVTQARSRARIEPTARDLIEALSGPTDVALTVTPTLAARRGTAETGDDDE